MKNILIVWLVLMFILHTIHIRILEDNDRLNEKIKTLLKKQIELLQQ